MKIKIKKLLFKQYKPHSVLISVGIIFLLTGCESLPPGNPPEGPIVSISITNNQPLSPKDAINSMTTAIATCPQLYSGENIPSISLYPVKISDSDKKYELQLNHLTARLYRNLTEMNMIKLPTTFNTKNSDFLFSSTFFSIYNDDNDTEEETNQPKFFKWEVKLFSSKNKAKSIWRQNVTVSLKSKTASS